ncbi:hypothetical protein LTR78_007909 [Recurvomyces mirabilis]|uniref:Small ribosomal subunit protein bS18m n=1 Tax=Recurvomyces mirabilis TaxID=574656 RepID=A0AAE0TQV7_9PEZI|nr:hypothetical protein LTR78_007909 [Recurvomyces mirabilis]KAK5152444.1 hypothetical protein LTS14_008391 [Recurvomyces mirabilis]
MSFERAFQRLTLQSRPICQQCRRTFASSTRRREQQQSATSAITELLEASRSQNEQQPRHQRLNLSHPNRRTSPSANPDRDPSSASASSPAQRTNLHELGVNLIRQTRNNQATTEQRLTDISRDTTRRELEQQIPRRFRPGDIYAPHDLSGVEMSKWKRLRRKPRVPSHGRDVLDQLGIDPRKEYKNFSMMNEYVTEMGRIKHRNDTGLRPVNQRRMAKAVRRAIGSGVLMPSVYKHPELIKAEMAQRSGGRY